MGVIFGPSILESKMAARVFQLTGLFILCLIVSKAWSQDCPSKYPGKKCLMKKDLPSWAGGMMKGGDPCFLYGHWKSRFCFISPSRLVGCECLPQCGCSTPTTTPKPKTNICKANNGKTCLTKKQLPRWVARYMKDTGDPCFKFRWNRRYCFVSRRRIASCTCKPECGCNGQPKAKSTTPKPTSPPKTKKQPSNVCQSNNGKTCLMENKLPGWAVKNYMKGTGNPCFKYGRYGRGYCFVSHRRIATCTCKPECGCKTGSASKPTTKPTQRTTPKPTKACISSVKKARCLPRKEVPYGARRYMKLGDPCFEFGRKKRRYCFIDKQARLDRCECTPECGCNKEGHKSCPGNKSKKKPGNESTKKTSSEKNSKCDSSQVPKEFPLQCDLGSQNTLCKYKSMGKKCNNQVCRVGLTAADKKALVEKHNQLRQFVAEGKERRGTNGKGQPKAKAMPNLVWDDELAASAQRWADQCDFGHDKDRKTKNYSGHVGQNAAMTASSSFTPPTTADMNNFVQMWYNEVKDFDPDLVSKFSNKQPPNTGVVGHYTQVVWAKTTKVGCGYVQFKDGKWYKQHLICNYYPGGNYLGSAVYEEA